jgi:alpha-L-rhamnosidase
MVFSKCSRAHACLAIGWNWRREGRKLELEVQVPVNTRATVPLPVSDRDPVTESGKDVGSSDGVTFLRMEGG